MLHGKGRWATNGVIYDNVGKFISLTFAEFEHSNIPEKSVIRKFAILSTMVLLALLSAQAQDAGSAGKAAPLPSQILAAKKVFISNAGGEFDPGYWSGDLTRTYSEFYAALKSWGRYQIVLTPADADLVLQISFDEPIASITTGSSIKDPQFRLILLDPKTNVLLWTFTEHVQSKIGLKKSRDRLFDEALANVVDDLKRLTAEAAVTH